VTAILLVDDNELQRKVVRAHLEHAGYIVTTACNGREALEIAREAPPDLVVSDVVMDELDGFGLCRRMREEPALAQVPIVLLSAHYTSASDRELARSVGASDLIERTPEFDVELAWIDNVARNDRTPFRVIRTYEVYEQQLDATTRLTTKLLSQTRDSEHRLRTILDNATDTISLCTLEGELLEANARWVTVIGIPPERLIGLRFSELAATAEARDALDQLSTQLAGGSHLAVYALRHATGATVHMELHAKVMELDGRQVVLSIGRDITDRVHAAERAATIEAMYQSLVEKLPDTVWRLTADLTPVFLSPNFEKLTGITIEEMKGSRDEWKRRVHPEDLPHVMRAFHNCAVDLLPQEAEYRFHHRSGTWTWHHARMTPREEHGQRFIDGLTSDITARRRLEQSLVQSQKMEAIGALTGGIAHDFNNVLSVILTNSDFLLEALPETDPRRADVDEIRGAAERAAALTRQLLAFSRRQVLALSAVDLGELISGLGKMLGRMIGEHIELTIDRGVEVGVVRADVGQLEQVVMNLVVNARDAMPNGGRLQISASNDTVSSADSSNADNVPPGRYVVLEVTDTGCGMDAETRRRVFEPFFTTKDPGKGTGLGLSTAYGIIRQFGGYIVFHTVLDHGTVFRVFLPRTDDRLERASQRTTPASGGTESVLLVEDDPRVCKVVERMLVARGYRVHVASSADDAIAIAQRTPVQLVLSDVVMPGMSGPDVVARIRAVAPTVRVLLMSGYTEHPQLQIDEIVGGPGFIQKPFSSSILAKRIRELLDAEPPS